MGVASQPPSHRVTSALQELDERAKRGEDIKGELPSQEQPCVLTAYGRKFAGISGKPCCRLTISDLEETQGHGRT